MSLGARFTASAAAVVAAAIVVLSVVLYLIVQQSLLGQVDRSLRDRPRVLARQAGIGNFSHQLGDCHVLQLREDVNLDRGGFLTLVDEQGRTCTTPARAPSTGKAMHERARNVARGSSRAVDLTTVHIGGERYRIATARLREGMAVQVARPLSEIDGFLRQLRLVMLGIALIAIVVAAELGALVARYAIAPVRQLTEVVERIGRSRDLSQRVEVVHAANGGEPGADRSADDDEVQRLADRFNTMLDSLAQARTAHEQLISDASHELRTPLTSIRANVEVLARSDVLAPDDRAELVSDIVRQFEELTSTVNNVIDLARSAQPLDAGAEPLRLDELARASVERARLHSPHLEVTLDAAPCDVLGSEPRLQTAINNLVDNACRHGADGGRVEVQVRDGVVTVRDHGQGFDEADLPHVFDRYYRSRSSRAVAGSGLGLAIVRQVAETHGGSVEATNAPGGGAQLELRLPTLSETLEDPSVVLQPEART